ncbi:MAG: hypothetical protein ACH37Z_12745 [Anaerolineae bacterium]
MLRHPSLNRVRGLAIISLLMLAGSAFPLAHPQAIHASDAAGVYSLVEDIAFEADPARPDEALRIRVYGVHALAYRPQTGEQPRLGIYTEPAEGYLYFACGPGDSATCRLEWQDLLKAVGSERCAAFGDRYLTDPKPNGRLRPADEAPANPDRYPIGQGVLMVQQGDTNTCGALRRFAAERGTPSPTPGLPTTTEAPPTDQPSATPTAKPAATTALPEVKTSPTPGRFLPPGALLLPQLQSGGTVGSGTPAATGEMGPSAKDPLPNGGSGADVKGRPRFRPYAILLLSVLGTVLAGTRGRRKQT